MAYFALCENLRCWHFLRPRCSWRSEAKAAVRRLPAAVRVVRGQEERRLAAGEWAEHPHRVACLARGATFFLMRAADAPTIHRAMEAFARMASVAPRIWRAEASVVTPDKSVLFKNVWPPVRRVPIRTNAGLLNIVNIRSANRAIWEMPTRDVWAGRKCRRGNVYQGLRPARQECLRRNPMIRSRA